MHISYFIRNHCVISIDDEEFIEGDDEKIIPDMFPIKDDYMPYDTNASSITERRFEYLMCLTVATQKLLIKTGHLGGTYGETVMISCQGWEYFQARMIKLDSTNSLFIGGRFRDTKQLITHMNLTSEECCVAYNNQRAEGL